MQQDAKITISVSDLHHTADLGSSNNYITSTLRVDISDNGEVQRHDVFSTGMTFYRI
jgi:hypothetical protein